MIERAYLKSAREVLDELKVRVDTGLSTKEVERRRVKYGLNDLPQDERRSLFLLFLERFKDVMVLILTAAALVSIFMGRASDAIIIGLAILLDVVLSLLQQWRTERALEALRRQIRLTVLANRNGKERIVSGKELVPGDIIKVEAGEKVPADARLISVQGLRIREAALTGESDEIEKTSSKMQTKTMIANRKNMIFMGTAVVNGGGTAVVVATGTQTELGKIALVLKKQKSPASPLRRKLQQTGIVIGGAIIGIVFILTVLGLALGQDLRETLLTATTLIVSAIPEDLTAILTVVLTVGVARILRQKGVVRELGSGETLGAATVICTDKTGTLTRGEMTGEKYDFMQGDVISKGSPLNNKWQEMAITTLALASDAHRTKDEDNVVNFIGSATGRAALQFVDHFGYDQDELRRQWKLLDSISFDSRWKYRAVLHQHPTKSTNNIFIAGAPDVLLDKSRFFLNRQFESREIEDNERYELVKRTEELAKTGKRMLGVAVRQNFQVGEVTHADIEELVFLGVLLIDDPIRKDVGAVIKQTMAAGIKVKLVTGDHPETAKHVARGAGMSVTEDAVVTSEMLEKVSDIELRELVQKTSIFARVTPLDKQRIVNALKDLGEVVAMTGDGINDAVALKTADIGVAMGSGQDIAKEASDLVLLDDRFHTIAAAIREGRVIRDNIRKVIAFLLATNAAEVMIFFVSILAGWPLPLLPGQVLWVNLVTDGTSDLALSLEPAEKGVMKRKPENPDMPILGQKMYGHILFTGVIMTAISMGMYWYLLNSDTSLNYARTMTFTYLSITSLLTVWSFRSLKMSLFEQGFRGNIWVLYSMLASAGFHVLAIYVPHLQRLLSTVPLGWGDWLIILVLAAVSVLLIDLRKIWTRGKGYRPKVVEEIEKMQEKLMTSRN